MAIRDEAAWLTISKPLWRFVLCRIQLTIAESAAQYWTRQSLLLVIWTFFLCACSTTGSQIVRDAPELAIPFKSNISVQDSAHGCSYRANFKEPLDRVVPFVVVLGHGFLQSLDNMEDLSTALAQAGVATVTLDFCHMKLWNAHHQRNGAEMIALADSLGVEKVVYAGFSAGALAALVAAAKDKRARGLVLLDLVDQSPIGVTAREKLHVPVISLVGKPSRCNGYGNSAGLLTVGPNVMVEEFNTASHCAFESPTTWICNRLCSADTELDQRQRVEIIDGIVKRVLGLAGHKHSGASMR